MNIVRGLVRMLTANVDEDHVVHDADVCSRGKTNGDASLKGTTSGNVDSGVLGVRSRVRCVRFVEKLRNTSW